MRGYHILYRDAQDEEGEEDDAEEAIVSLPLIPPLSHRMPLYISDMTKSKEIEPAAPADPSPPPATSAPAPSNPFGTGQNSIFDSKNVCGWISFFSFFFFFFFFFFFPFFFSFFFFFFFFFLFFFFFFFLNQPPPPKKNRKRNHLAPHLFFLLIRKTQPFPSKPTEKLVVLIFLAILLPPPLALFPPLSLSIRRGPLSSLKRVLTPKKVPISLGLRWTLTSLAVPLLDLALLEVSPLLGVSPLLEVSLLLKSPLEVLLLLKLLEAFPL